MLSWYQCCWYQPGNNAQNFDGKPCDVHNLTLFYVFDLILSRQQLQEQERRRIQEYENYLKEKCQVDEIVKKIYEEDKR